MPDTKAAAPLRATFHYLGLLEDGSVFFDSRKGEPMACELGRHALMPALEAAISAMIPGEQRRVEVGMAYGPYDGSALQRHVLRSAVQDGGSLCDGQQILWTSPRNPATPVQATVRNADEFAFDLDFNHPLAGHDLAYEVELLELQ
jgi:FKBP-type peptidyl-prolyl cis-trans isomerase 2